MKYSDIVRLHELGLINEEQRQQIIEKLQLKEDSGSKLLLVLSAVGAVLIVTGIILLISANWDSIHRGAKILAGIALMLGAWAGGWYLREHRGTYPKSGEALYLVGGGLWLANIALVGQIYHLSSHAPNAILLWLAGLAALPWLLRSKALFVLCLLAGWLWLGMEANDRNSWFGTRWEEAQLALFALTGLLVHCWGIALRRSHWSQFSGPAEKTGLLALLGSLYPLCWHEWHYGDLELPAAGLVFLIAVSLGAMGLLVRGLTAAELNLNRQWRWTWGLALAGLGALVWNWLIDADDFQGQWMGFSWLASVSLFLFALLQVEVGVALQSRFHVNLAVALLAFVILACYISLFGSMATTGWMFLISGIFLIGFGIYLEKKRRKLLARMKAPRPATTQP